METAPPLVSQPPARGGAWEKARISARCRMLLLQHLAERAVGVRRTWPVAAEQLDRGITFVLPGIEAESLFTHAICDGLVAGGLPGAVQVFDWGLTPWVGHLLLQNLLQYQRNRQKAAELTRQVVEYQDLYPGRPVHVVAHSGGAGLALWAVEGLPEGRGVESVVLLGGAVSPTYDLRPVLRKTRRGVHNSYSHKDWITLNLGTRVFGTTDRRRTPACGHAGFVVPEKLDGEVALYQRLTQLAWSPEMGESCGHYGGHLTSGCAVFVREHVTPWMRG